MHGISLNRFSETLNKVLAAAIALTILLTTTVVPLRYLYLLEKQGSHASVLSGGSSGSDQDKFVVKIPIALPYSSDWDSPKAAEGLIERNGEFYTIVSKNYVNDTLYIECLQNSNAKKIFNSLSDHLESFSDFSGDKSKSQSHGLDIIKLLTQSFFPLNNHIPCFGVSFRMLDQRVAGYFSSMYASPSLLLESPPPQGFVA